MGDPYPFSIPKIAVLRHVICELAETGLHRKEGPLPMRTPKALSVAVLIAAGIFSAPGAQAQERLVEVAFTYNPSDSAKDIYSDLQRTARDACRIRGAKALYLKKREQACEKQVIENGVTKLNRADVAAIHAGVYASNDTRG